jgi:hypothetical protein
MTRAVAEQQKVASNYYKPAGQVDRIDYLDVLAADAGCAPNIG